MEEQHIWCRCRACGTKYDPNKSRADWKGYCSMACQHAMAYKHGYRKQKTKSHADTEYSVLSKAGQIGDTPW